MTNILADQYHDSMASTMTTAQREQARLLIEQGLARGVIARSINVPVLELFDAFPPTDTSSSQWKLWRQDGLNNAQIAAVAGVSRQRVHQVLEPVPKRGKVKEVRLRLNEETEAKVAQIAHDLGALSWRGNNAGQGSISVMLDGIADGQFTVAPTDE